MSNQFSPYPLFLEKAKTEKFRKLAASSVQTAKEFHRLQNDFPKSIAENPSKRRKKGSPVRHTKRQKEFLAEADKDASKASAYLENVYRSIEDEQALAKTALQDEKFDFQTWAWLYKSVHKDDRPMAKQIRQLQQKLIDDLESYLAGS